MALRPVMGAAGGGSSVVRPSVTRPTEDHVAHMVKWGFGHRDPAVLSGAKPILSDKGVRAQHGCRQGQRGQ
eukprot:2834839-Pleurochrysis_carterae.AAC.1